MLALPKTSSALVGFSRFSSQCAEVQFQIIVGLCFRICNFVSVILIIVGGVLLS